MPDGLTREGYKVFLDNPQGTGLFIANQIAQRHNADIRMENKAESGCRITVVFWKHRPGNNTM